ncbi:MAG: hypothetical protein Q7U54_16940 [Bacteroidales bacterium]|nr:hypothetical protein [Bacteroidales bacterium]
MKTLKLIPFLILLMFLGYAVKAQDNTKEKLNLPGDNLNLYAVMDLFRESETLEAFEKNLNAEDSKINNLDLNNDDKIDYIRVADNVDGDVHTIILQVAVTEKENQDVAVFTVQKDNMGQVQVQLIGDEELYGKDYIIEPNYADTASETPNPGFAGNNNTTPKETVVVTKTTYVEVASWPVVTYIYVPTYRVWRSPWYWGYYPSYWNPWRPYYWDYYYGYHSHYYNYYYGYYRHSYYNRYPHYNDRYYHGHRSYSNTVYQHRQSGIYKSTYSRPDTRSQGSADFNKKYPDGYRPAARPASNTNSIRPTAKPSTRPATTKPSTRPAVNKPSTRPTTTTPATKAGATRPATTKPSTRPAVSKPSARPATTTPATKAGTTRPATTKPSARPAVSKPSARPATTTATPKATARPATRSATKSTPARSSSGTQKSSTNSRSEKPK